MGSPGLLPSQNRGHHKDNVVSSKARPCPSGGQKRWAGPGCFLKQAGPHHTEGISPGSATLDRHHVLSPPSLAGRTAPHSLSAARRPIPSPPTV